MSSWDEWIRVVLEESYKPSAFASSYFSWDDEPETIVVQENPETFEHRDRNIKYRNIKSLEE